MRGTKVREDKWIARASYPVHWEHSKHKNIDGLTGSQATPRFGCETWLYQVRTENRI